MLQQCLNSVTSEYSKTDNPLTADAAKSILQTLLLQVVSQRATIADYLEKGKEVAGRRYEKGRKRFKKT